MPETCNWFDAIPAHRRRYLPDSQRHGIRIEVDGRRLVNFASNDYLGLSFHPQVCRAAANAIESEGMGSGASRLVSGDAPVIHTLEAALAEWKGYQACLTVGSGMLANIGLLQAISDRHTHLFTDRMNHASLVDGARLGGGRVHRYAHLDLVRLEHLLQKYPARRRIIVSDGVFSMDGDCADIAILLALAEAHDAIVVLDDAHGTGTIGPEGRGLTRIAGMQGHPRLIEVGTLGKAFGVYGAFILGNASLIDGLRQRLRTFIYSTALPAALAHAALAALAIIRDGRQVQALHANLALFKSLTGDLPLSPSDTPIQPLIIGSDRAALHIAEALRRNGFFVPAIRPPTVPQGTARLRITLSAAHTAEQVEGLCTALGEIVT